MNSAKYRFVVEDKAQKKMLKVSKKGDAKAKKAGAVRVSLMVKSGKTWVKDEEHEARVEQPVARKKDDSLKVGSAAQAADYLTGLTFASPTSYASSDESVVSIDPLTGKMTVLKQGSTVITAYFGAGKGAAKYKTRVRVK